LPYNNKRTQESEERRRQKRLAKKYIFETSYKDDIIKEIIETQTPTQVDNHVLTSLVVDTPQVYFSMNEGWSDGLVLISQLTFSIYQHMLELPSGRKHHGNITQS
jgi:hypothetical protein